MCSLVSSSFRDPSQRKLFHAIHVTSEIYDSSIRQNARLLNILLTNPRIVSFIRTLWLGIGATFCCAPGVSSALCKLSHVQKIILETTHGLTPWESLHEDFRADSLHPVSPPAVQILLLGEVDFPIGYLRNLTHKTHLFDAFFRCTFRQYSLADHAIGDSQGDTSRLPVDDHSMLYLGQAPCRLRD